MAQKIPFFELFQTIELSPKLRGTLAGAYLSSVEVDRSTRSMCLFLSTPEDLGEELGQLEKVIAQAYALDRVQIRQQVIAPQKDDSTAAEKTPEGGEVIFGAPIRAAVSPMTGLNPKMGGVVVAGRVFFSDLYETRRPGVYCLTFDITDFQSSVRVTKYMQKEEKAAFKKDIKSGMWLKVQGYIKLNRDGTDIILDPKNIMTYPHEMRMDTAPVKRVELHMHSSFSNMDALSSLSPKGNAESNIVKRAEAWGHPAIAITDHGVVQGFPDAWHSAKNIKILYGMEGYYVNNLDDRVAVHGEQEHTFSDEYVAFDIETTGLQQKHDAITEIGAVLVKGGDI